MKAIVCTRYGSPEVLELHEVKNPNLKADELLIKVYAASATTADCMMRTGKPYVGRLFTGLKKPKNPITGTGFAGVVEAIGKKVKDFQTGDEVFGETTLSFGTNAEYICIAEDDLVTHKPVKLSFEEAAPLCDGPLTSMNFLKDLANVQPGQKVLVNGASGSLGTAAIQLAKYFGTEVTGVCSTKNIDLVKSLGADFVIDYTRQDFTASNERYDIVYDTIGKSSFSRCKRVLSSKGIYMSPVLGFRLLLQMMWTSAFSSKKVSATGIRLVPELKALLLEIKKIIHEGKLISVLDRSFSLEETAAAHRYIENGHKRGNVVIKINH